MGVFHPGSILPAGTCPVPGCSVPPAGFAAGFCPGPANLALPGYGEIRLVTISLFFSSFQTENYSFDSNYVNSRAHLIKRYVGSLESAWVCPAKSRLFNVLPYSVTSYLLFSIRKTFREPSFVFKNSVYFLLRPTALGLQRRQVFSSSLWLLRAGKLQRVRWGAVTLTTSEFTEFILLIAQE